MPVTQISVFTESKPGHLLRVLQTIGKAHINVRGYSVSDTGDYGVARFIVDDPEKASSVLKESGFACNLNDVVVVKLPDFPGSLASILDCIKGAGINITYSYSLISTYIAIASSDALLLEDTLNKANANVVSIEDINS